MKQALYFVTDSRAYAREPDLRNLGVCVSVTHSVRERGGWGGTLPYTNQILMWKLLKLPFSTSAPRLPLEKYLDFMSAL
jgi:hypothetical protein